MVRDSTVRSPLRIRHAPDSSGWGHQAHVAVSVSSARLGLTNPNRPRGLAPFPTEGGVDSSNRPGSWSHPPIRLTLGMPHLSAGALVEYRRLRLTRLGEPRGHAVLSVSTPRRSTRGGDAHLARVGEPRHLESCQRRHLLWWRPPASQQRRLPWRRPPGFASSAVSGSLRPRLPPSWTPAARRARSRPYVRVACRAARCHSLDPTSGEPRAVSALRVVISRRPKRACSLRRCE